MKEEDYYPAGAYNDPNAPYNQPDEQAPIDVDVTISQTLSRVETIEVTDYSAECWEDVEPDNDGGFYRVGGIKYDLSNTDLLEEYKNTYYTIPELLDKLKAYLIAEIAESKNTVKNVHLNRMLKCCDGWTVDEEIVIEN